MSVSGGDQVGVDNEFASPPRPWDQGGWLKSRLKELGYTLCSWPYLIAATMTALFVLTVLQRRSDPLALQAMIGSWTLAFVRREWAAWIASKKGA